MDDRDDRDASYERRAGRDTGRSAALALLFLLAFAGSILLAGLMLSAGGNTVAGSPSNNFAPSVQADEQAVAAAVGVVEQQLKQVQTNELIARQEVANVQAELDASRVALQQSQEGLSRAEARVVELETQLTVAQRQLEQLKSALPVLLGIVAVFVVLVVSVRMIVGHRQNRRLHDVQERERKTRWEATRMRVMYHDALEKAQGQLDIMRSQLMQARGSVARQPSEHTTVSRSANR